MSGQHSLPNLLKDLIRTIDHLEAAGSLYGEGLTAARNEIEALDAYVDWFVLWQTKTAVPEGVEPTPEEARVQEYQRSEFEEPIREYIEVLKERFIRWSEDPPGFPSN